MGNHVSRVVQPSARALIAEEMAIPRKSDIADLAAVRIAVVDHTPTPSTEPLCTEAVRLGFTNDAIAGRAIGHVVWLNRRHTGNRTFLAQELAHVAQ